MKKQSSYEDKKLALHYMGTLVAVARESFLILDAKLRVISANPVFYENFKVSSKKTEGRFIYDLGNGQWNIFALRSLLEKILPEKKIVKNYHVTHIFETIGERTMLLNARQIDTVQLIILAIEDITPRKQLENRLAEYAKGLEVKIADRTAQLENKLKQVESLNKSMVGREMKMMELKKEIVSLKRRIKNGNGKNGNGRNGNHRNGH